MARRDSRDYDPIWRRCNAPGWGADWHRFCEGPQNLPGAASRDEAAGQVCRAIGIPFGPHIIAAMDELSKEMSDGH